MELDYPSAYRVPAVPAGKSIAIARWMGIATLIVYVMIVAACGMILWTAHSRKIDPFIFYENALTGQWDIVGRTSGKNQYTIDEMMKIASISHFVQEWFFISTSFDDNVARWADCDRHRKCTTTDDDNNDRLYGDNSYAICCMTDGELFERFVTTVLPDYEIRADGGESWRVNLDTLQIVPTQTPALWQVTATITSNMGNFDILAYAHIAHSSNMYLNTMGYYVDDFDAYRIR